jgi:hypothetical protein
MQPGPRRPVPFVVGHQYTRENIFDILGLQPHPTGGNWFTGYNAHQGDWYVFAHIETAGRTGHDYENAWEGDLLRWRGKTGSRLEHDSIRSMLHPAGHVFVFTRERDRDPFTFQGAAEAERSADTVPVTVWWRFHDPNGPAGGDAVASPGLEEEGREQGAGFGQAEDNSTVERAAVAHVTGCYRRDGWDVSSVETERLGYDLRCTRGGEERHVEVKGVAGSVPAFMLTEGERRAAASDPLWRVAVVTEALGSNPRYQEVAGTELLAGWQLAPVTWRVSPPAAR